MNALLKSPLVSHAQQLKQQLKSLRPNLTDAHATRLHRSISWLTCASEQENNLDIKIISLWISFNACFAVDEGSSESLAERDAFQSFIKKIVEHDNKEAIYASLWQTYSGPVKALIKNPYVFHGFWSAKRINKMDESWRLHFDQSSVAALNSLSRKQVPELLSIVLDRLFVLRNQLLYGGATYQSKVNREQVLDGGKLLGALLPVIINIMLTAPEEDWGEIYYPIL